MSTHIISQFPYNNKKYNDLLRTATIAVKLDEFVSLRGFQPLHAKWWQL